MRFRAAGHAYSYFLAEEEVRAGTQVFRTVQRVMVGDGDSRHTPMFQDVVDFKGLAIALLTEVFQPWSVAHSRSFRVNMKVASHEAILGLEYEQPMKREQNLRKCAYGTY
ncbi:MAG: hypothetical protein DMG37_05185 [Acidobacteria bacterium]|nr:MAG: hypothetical protein DMG37_05185 [Acidobacteriota bacterium]